MHNCDTNYYDKHYEFENVMQDIVRNIILHKGKNQENSSLRLRSPC